MALISNSFPGRRDGNYSLIFGDDDIGSLISAIHATSIQMGNELERIIPEFARIIDESLIDDFFNKKLEVGIYIIPKAVLKDKRLKFDEIPDALVVNVSQNMCRVFEIKLGDNFDTKKSKGEVEHLKSYASKLDKATTYRISIGVCMWYAKDKIAVVNGFKNNITIGEAFTGVDFCKMTNLDYDQINKRIAMHQDENCKFFFNKFNEIFDVNENSSEKNDGNWGKIYCKWANSFISLEALPDMCISNINNDQCDICYLNTPQSETLLVNNHG